MNFQLIFRENFYFETITTKIMCFFINLKKNFFYIIKYSLTYILLT